MEKRSRSIAIAIVVALVVAGLAYLAVQLRNHGFSAREEPWWLEKVLARNARRLAMPTGAKKLRNPRPLTPEGYAEGREHWVAHCSTCHGLDGRGNTTIGRNLYPKPPDMTGPETQELTDGELFYIISNGVRFTGMPAWGSEDSPPSIWELVAFIRRLPQLTPDELKLIEGVAAGAGSEAKGATPKGHTHAPGRAPHKH